MKTDQQQVKHSKVSLIAKKIYFVDENINLKNACTVTFNGHKVCLMVFNATFSNFSAIAWRPVFIGGGSRITRRKPPTCGRKTGNPCQLRLESSTPYLQRMEPAISVLTDHVIVSRRTTLTTLPLTEALKFRKRKYYDSA